METLIIYKLIPFGNFLVSSFAFGNTLILIPCYYGNSEIPIAEALRCQIEVQKRLQEQLEVYKYAV